MSGKFDFLQGEFDPTNIPELEGEFNPDEFKQENKLENQPNGELVDSKKGLENEEDDIDDWDSFAEKKAEEDQDSEEDIAQLEMINKISGDKKFTSVKEYQDFLAGKVEKKEETEVETLDQKIDAVNVERGKISALLDFTPEELISMSIKRDDPNATEEDIELEIQQMKDNGSFKREYRTLKSAVSNRVSQFDNSIQKLKDDDKAAISAKRVQSRTELKEAFKNNYKLFGEHEVGTDISKEAYKSIVDGTLGRDLRDQSKLMEIATLLAMRQDITKAFAQMKQSGHAFESGKYAVLSKAANVKSKNTQGGQSSFASLFEGGDQSLEDIVENSMEFVDTSKK